MNLLGLSTPPRPPRRERLRPSRQPRFDSISPAVPAPAARSRARPPLRSPAQTRVPEPGGGTGGERLRVHLDRAVKCEARYNRRNADQGLPLRGERGLERDRAGHGPKTRQTGGYSGARRCSGDRARGSSGDPRPPIPSRSRSQGELADELLTVAIHSPMVAQRSWLEGAGRLPQARGDSCPG